MAADIHKTIDQPMTINELSDHLGIPTYRLLSWETYYPSITSSQGYDGIRVYSPETIKLIKEVARLSQEEKRKVHEIRDILQAMHRDKRQINLSPGATESLSFPKKLKTVTPRVKVSSVALLNELERARDFLKVIELSMSLQAEFFVMKSSDQPK